LSTPSVQLAAWHTLPVQTLLSQSAPELHDWPGVHTGQLGPPQSVSVSVPLVTPSGQIGG
jgi:hypothetical protein